MENFFEMHRSRFQTLLKDLIASLQAGIGSLPQEHFDELRNKMFDQIGRMETPQPTGGEEIASPAARNDRDSS